MARDTSRSGGATPGRPGLGRKLIFELEAPAGSQHQTLREPLEFDLPMRTAIRGQDVVAPVTGEYLLDMARQILRALGEE